jgi:hypothetical protein
MCPAFRGFFASGRWGFSFPQKAPGLVFRFSPYFSRIRVAGYTFVFAPFETLEDSMCRNIRTLFNFEPPVSEDEIRAASLQFVRKISGFNKPSKANEASFQAAIDEVAAASARLLYALETTAPPKNREEEAAKAKARAMERFGD